MQMLLNSNATGAFTVTQFISVEGCFFRTFNGSCLQNCNDLDMMRSIDLNYAKSRFSEFRFSDYKINLIELI